MREIEKIKYQSRDINIPAGSGANEIVEATVELDTHYHECTGVVAYEKQNGGDNNYDLGINDDTRTYHHLTHKQDWLPGNGVPLNERYKDITIPVIGNNLTIRVKPSVALATEIKVQVVFRLVRYKA